MKSYNKRFIILVIISLFLIYAACNFYLSKGNYSIIPWVQLDPVINGVILIVMIGITSAAFYFYKSEVTAQRNESPRLRLELGAYEIVADEIKKSSNNLIKSTIDEVKQVRKDRKISINMNRLTPILVKGDHVRLLSGPDAYNPFVDCVIEDIDTANQKAHLGIII
jgi:hypothetical protein